MAVSALAFKQTRLLWFQNGFDLVIVGMKCGQHGDSPHQKKEPLDTKSRVPMISLEITGKDGHSQGTVGLCVFLVFFWSSGVGSSGVSVLGAQIHENFLKNPYSIKSY